MGSLALACKNLLSVSNRKALSTLQNLLPRLEPLYQHMIEDILVDNNREDRQLCLQILHSIWEFFWPLSLEELTTTARLPIDFLKPNYLLDLIGYCSLFITV